MVCISVHLRKSSTHNFSNKLCIIILLVIETLYVERICEFVIKSHKLSIDFVQGGIVIVDSPGIGESRQMTQMVKDYFATAFAFIYVINSGNAGGLQPDRVGG